MKRGYENTTNIIIYEWKIRKFSTYITGTSAQASQRLDSSKFSSVAVPNQEWSLVIHLNNNSSEYISFQLYDTHNNPVFSNYYDLYIILANKTKKIIPANLRRWHKTEDVFEGNKLYYKADFLKEKQTVLPSDTLTLRAEINYTEKCKSLFDYHAEKKAKYHLMDDMCELYKSKNASDVVINVQGKSFRAHKVILSARSPVFAAMFTHNTIERKNNEILIPDIRPEVFDRLLEFVYTDQVTNIGEVNEELLEAANKYQLRPLVEICGISLTASATVKNSVRRLILAELHNVKELMESLVDFIVNNAVDVMKTPEFKIIEQEKPSLSCMLFKRLVEINHDNPKITFVS